MTALRFLVTGGCGFIGSHLVDALLGRGDRVTVLDDLSSGHLANLAPDAVLHRGSINDPDAVAAAMRGADGVFHLAAIASVARCRDDWAASHTTNLTGAIRVMEAARPLGCPVVYASSAAVYGDQAAARLVETDPTIPLSPYGADKRGCELHAAAAAACFGLRTLGLRLFNVYGPRQDPASPYAGVISVFQDRLRRGDALQIRGDGEQRRDFIAVSDVVAALLAGMDRLRAGTLLPDVLNVCTGQTVSINRLAAILGRLHGVAPRLTHGGAVPGDIRHSCGDPSRAVAALGLAPALTLADGLRAMGPLATIAA